MFGQRICDSRAIEAEERTAQDRVFFLQDFFVTDPVCRPLGLVAHRVT